MGEPSLFRIELAGGAARDLQQLPAEVQHTVLREIRRWLGAFPFREIKTRIKKLSGFIPPPYRLRVGDYRVYYRILSDRVVVLALLHKKASDRWLQRSR